MKKHTTTKRNLSSYITMAFLLLSLAVIGVPSAFAIPGDNTATGDIGGVALDLTDSLTFNLTATTLGIVKAAYLDATDVALTSGNVLPKGTVVNFLIYVDNTTPIQVNDISLADVLDVATFSYTGGSLKILNTTATGTAVDTIYADVKAVAAGGTSDANDLDVAGSVAGLITAGDQGAAVNGTLDIAPSAVWALLYTVTML